MHPHSWHIVHVASFIISLVTLGAVLASVAGVVPSEWNVASVIALLLAFAVHYASDPRRSWVTPHREDAV